MNNKQPQKQDPRLVAMHLLRAVLDERHSLDEACARNSFFTVLDPRDRSFARLLVLTACRQLPVIDELIDLCLEKPVKGDGGKIRHILRLGLVQLLYLGTPPHAAVGATVALTNDRKLARFKGLVNAVLRRVDREGAEMQAVLDETALRQRGWLWKGWSRQFGKVTAAAIVDANAHEAPLDITVKGEPEKWAELLGADLLPTGSLRLPQGTPVEQLSGFEDGDWWVQDAAAALPVTLMGDMSGKRVVDICAAPGGKTLQLAAAGAQVTALDKSNKRLDRLRENLQRTGLNAMVVAGDALTWTGLPADAVLLDAPCSATGTIRRHPELPFIRKPEDVADLIDIQASLLDKAVDMVKPGGMVVYATCSLQREEGEGQVEAILSRRDNVSLLPLTRDDLPALPEAITSDGYLRCLPSMWADQGGMDGFFVARLVRKS